MRLENKTALVTGAGSGIGKCIAETYAREGARVALADIDFDAAKSAARAIGNNAIALRCDVARKADFEAAVADTLAAFGGARHPGQQCRHHARQQADARDHRGRIRPHLRGERRRACFSAARRWCRCSARRAAASSSISARPPAPAAAGHHGLCRHQGRRAHADQRARRPNLPPTASASAPSRRSRPKRRCCRASSVRCPASARNSSPPFRSAVWRRCRTSPMPRCSSPRPTPNSSPAISWRSTAAAASNSCRPVAASGD